MTDQKRGRALVITSYEQNFHNYRRGVDVELKEILSPAVDIVKETDDLAALTLEEFCRYDLVIFYAAATWGMQADSDFMTDLISYLVNGGSVMILHINSLGVTAEGAKVFQGRFRMHPPYTRYHFVPAEGKEDGILDGVNDFYADDEMHMLFTDDHLPVDVLLYCENDDGQPPAKGAVPHQDIYGKNSALPYPLSWRYPYGCGKVVFSVPGHDAKGLKTQENRRLILNAARWLLA